MDKQFDDGTLVELLPGREDLYQYAIVGSRGTILATRTDSYGYEKVLVEWDKDHWRYNGEPDGWTYASHFREIKPEAVIDIPAEELMAEEIFDSPVPSLPPIHTDREEDMAQYIESIGAAFEGAAESDAFYLITMKKVIDPMGQEGIMIDMKYAAANDELSGVPDSELFRFVEQEIRRREQ